VVINKYLAELVGTFILVILGSMSILGAGSMGLPPILTVPFGFGLGLLAAIFAVGHVSGGHFNPAVTLGMYLDKRTSASDLVGYWAGQFVGAILASLALVAVTSRQAVAQTVTAYPDGELGLGIMSELILTTIFVLVILASTRTAPAVAGVAISLTLVVVHFAGIPFSGASVNPARSFAPAIVGAELTGLWVYLVVPLVGAAVAWGLWQLFRPDALDLHVGDSEEVVVEEVVVQEEIVEEVDIPVDPEADPMG
jgi:aquaporin Z